MTTPPGPDTEWITCPRCNGGGVDDWGDTCFGCNGDGESLIEVRDEYPWEPEEYE